MTIAITDFTIVPVMSIIGNPHAVVAGFIVTLHIPASAASMVIALDDPAPGYPNPYGNILPIATISAIVTTVANDRGRVATWIIVMPAVVDC